MATRAYHHGNLREELLERAVVTLRERGVQELSLRELAREVGVSHAAPRRHFADRQALLDALAENGFIALGTLLREAAAASEGGFADRLVAMAEAYIRFAIREAALLEIMFAGKHRDPDGPVKAAADANFSGLVALVEAGQALGVIGPADAADTATVFFAAMQGLASLATGGVLDDDELERLIPDTVQRLLRGSAP